MKKGRLSHLRIFSWLSKHSIPYPGPVLPPTSWWILIAFVLATIILGFIEPTPQQVLSTRLFRSITTRILKTRNKQFFPAALVCLFRKQKTLSSEWKKVKQFFFSKHLKVFSCGCVFTQKAQNLRKDNGFSNIFLKDKKLFQWPMFKGYTLP